MESPNRRMVHCVHQSVIMSYTNDTQAAEAISHMTLTVSIQTFTLH